MRQQKMTVLGSQIGVILALLVIWELIARSGLAAENAFPPFSAVAAELIQGMPTSRYWTAVWQTLQGALQGFLVAAVVGIPLGVVVGFSPFLEKSSRILVDFGRSFPAIALLPIFVLSYGSTITTKTIVIAVGCVFPIFVQSFYGARRVDPAIVETAKAFRIPAGMQLTRIVLPSAVPSIMTGLRLGITMAVLLSIGVEILAGIPGLGQRIAGAQQDGASAVAFAYILTASALGFAVSKLSQAVESRLLRWRPPTTVS